MREIAMKENRVTNQLIRIKSLDGMRLPGRNFKIDGEKVKTRTDFFLVMEETLCFPECCDDSIDAFSDWMRDLSWIAEDHINVIIYSEKSFLSKDLNFRNLILDVFSEDILPFWESEVLYTVVEGKCKNFNVYLVIDSERQSDGSRPLMQSAGQKRQGDGSFVLDKGTHLLFQCVNRHLSICPFVSPVRRASCRIEHRFCCSLYRYSPHKALSNRQKSLLTDRPHI